MLIKKVSWFVKEWNIFQVNDLHKVEEQKSEARQQFCWRKIWDSIEFMYSWKGKEWVRDTKTLIIVKIYKHWSCLRIEG